MVALPEKYQKVVNLANALSLLRLLLGPVFMIAVFRSLYIGAFIIILIATLTDFLDGKIARDWNMQTRIGKMLDPLADKVIILFGVMTLLIKFNFPLWVGVVVISRDVILLIGGSIFLLKNKQKVLVPNLLGKITTFFQMLVIVVYIAVDRFFTTVPRYLVYLLIIITAILTILSGIVYFIKGYQLFFTERKQKTYKTTKPGKIMNLPNKITLTRIALIPLFIAFLLSNIPYKTTIAAGLFIILALSDALDGYIARKRRQVTSFGTLFDPLADKLLITAALIFLIPKGIEAWMVYTIIAREFLVTGLRTIALTKNYVLSAKMSGKVKTFMQVVAIVAVLLEIQPYAWYLMIFAVAITIYSGIEYLWTERQLFKEIV